MTDFIGRLVHPITPDTNVHEQRIDYSTALGGYWATCTCGVEGPIRGLDNPKYVWTDSQGNKALDHQTARKAASLDKARHKAKVDPRRRTPTVRDSQRSALYAAEARAFRSTEWDTPVGDGSVGAAQAWLDDLVGQRWFQSRWGRCKPVIVPSSGNCAGYRSDIHLSRWGRSPRVILHELSHWLSYSRKEPAHGPTFAATMLVLVEGALGQEAAGILRREYSSGRRKVHWRKGVPSVPKPGTSQVITKTALAQKQRAAMAIPVTSSEAARAAAVVRRGIRLGDYGPSGSKARVAALLVAKVLEDRS